MTLASKIRSLLTPAQRRTAGWLVAMMVVGMVLETVGIGLVMPAVALFIQGDVRARYPQLAPLLERLGNPSQNELLVGGMLLLVGVYVIKTLYLGLLAWRQTRFVFGVQVEVSQRLFSTYLRQPYTFHLQRNSAQLIRNAFGEVAGLTAALTDGMTLLTESLVATGIAIMLIAIEPLGSMIVFIALGGATALFYRSMRARITRWGKARQLHDGLRIQHLQQGLGGAKDVKVLGREDDFLSQYGTHNQQSARAAQFQQTLQQLPRLWLELLAIVAMAALVMTLLAQGRSTPYIVSAMGLFAAASFRLMPSLNRVISAIQSLRYSLPVIDVLYDEFKLDPGVAAATGGAVPVLQREIRLDGVTYTYPDAPTPAVSGMSIRIGRGETVGIVGASGSGKSTLIDVILGLLSPESGSVSVDGADIRLNMRNWQDQIGYVPQFIYLTDDTLRRNVAFGLSGDQIDDAAVRRAIRAAQLEEFVASLPDGLETVIGERGVRLSGGQRQRIGIARALYHDPGVLILDEATSALDGATERGVMEAVSALHGQKTIIIVAHRLSTVERCDRLYRLDRGRVVGEGAAAAVIPMQQVV